ncbi:hypothetical protein CASFOL_035809 [Castilleja foliolosa]|uniref:Uncharacterized protein n=1 Tax=Castilleja foliolosa TaxID=1961234 RepID=A0ABD3BW25_9LAMI
MVIPKSQWLFMLVIFSFFMSSCNYLRANAHEPWKPIAKVKSAEAVAWGKLAVEKLNENGLDLVFTRVHQGFTRTEGDKFCIWIKVVCVANNMSHPMYDVKMYQIGGETTCTSFEKKEDHYYG